MFEYYGTADAVKYKTVGFWNPKRIEVGTTAAIYVEHGTKKAYALMDGDSLWIDYNAVIQNNTIVLIEKYKGF